MTPDAVLQRYLELAAAEPPDVEQLCELVSLDADLLSRWLRLFSLSAKPNLLQQAMSSLDGLSLTNLAQTQAWMIAPLEARLSFDQWQNVLRSSCLAEILAEYFDFDDPTHARWLTLLSLSGMNLPEDDELRLLNEFRGSSSELYEDAQLLPRILATVETTDIRDEREGAVVAESLLGLNSNTFHELYDQAANLTLTLMAKLGLMDDLGVDWQQKLAQQLQIAALTSLFTGTRNLEELLACHRQVAAGMFGEQGMLFLAVEDHLIAQTNSEQELPHISVHSKTSKVAQVYREGKRHSFSPTSNSSIADRQIADHFSNHEALLIPLRSHDQACGVLLFRELEDLDVELLENYCLSFARWLRTHLYPPVSELGGEQAETLANYQARQEKRLRAMIHEANNPLSIVRNYLHILEVRLQKEPEILAQLEMVGEEIRRAAGIIAEMRNLAPVEDKKDDTVQMSEQDLNNIVAKVVELQRPRAEEAGLRLHFDPQLPSVQIKTDADRCTQIVVNLVSNALDATPAPGVVQLTTQTGVYRRGVAGVELVIADTGPGLAPEILVKLFEPKESRKGGEHQGLGLHIVYQLVGDLKGEIDVRTSPDTGTSFAIFLPLASSD